MTDKKVGLRFHHQMVSVKDMDEAVHLFQDVLGFELVGRLVVPDEDVLDNTDHFESDQLQWEIVTMDSNNGAIIELAHAIRPGIQETPHEYLDYFYTGITELGFEVDNLEEWYDKIVALGYKTQPIFQAGTNNTCFCFWTNEGVIIQLNEDMTKPDVPRWERYFENPDQRSPQQIEMLQKSYKQ